MNEPKFIVTEKQILDAVKYALELDVCDNRIIDIIMRDIEDELDSLLYCYCKEV